MPFNSNSYYMNKYRRQAKEALAEARQHPERAKTRVAYARALWRSYLSRRRIKTMDEDMRLVRRGEMKASDFTDKWAVNKGEKT